MDSAINTQIIGDKRIRHWQMCLDHRMSSSDDVDSRISRDFRFHKTMISDQECMTGIDIQVSQSVRHLSQTMIVSDHYFL